jgi:LCP family protein required for cell wall assembly
MVDQSRHTDIGRRQQLRKPASLVQSAYIDELLKKVSDKKDTLINGLSDKTDVQSKTDLFQEPEVYRRYAGNITTFRNHSLLSNRHRSSQKQHRRVAAYVLVPFTVVVLILGILVGGRLSWFAGSVSSANNTSAQAIGNDIGATLGNSIPQLKDLDNSDLANAIRDNRRVNILMLGYGGDGHSGAYLTDSIMVISLDFATNKVTMISVPRDLWVQIPTDGNNGSYWKINAAYELGLDQKDYPNKLAQFTGPDGGGNEAKYVVSQVIGQPIDYYVAMDFTAFQNVVDAVGGVTINVPDTFTDYSYPNGDQNTSGVDCDASEPAAPDQSGCRYLTVHFDAGTQTMDGQRALEYSRSRHAAGPEGSDFARSRRQQQIVTAVEQKAAQGGLLTNVLNIMNAIQGHVFTDLSIAEVKDLSDYISGVNLDDATHGQLTDAGDSLLTSGYSQDGQWILEPTAGMNDFDQVHTYIYDLLNGIQYTSAPAAKTSSTTQTILLNPNSTVSPAPQPQTQKQTQPVLMQMPAN